MRERCRGTLHSQYTEFEHFGIIHFWVMLWILVWKCTYWPCDLDLWSFNPKTMSLIGYPKFITYTKLEHFGSFFLSYALNISVKNALTDPVTLTFQHQNHVTSRISQGHSLYRVWTLWGHSLLSYAVDRQTNRRTQKFYHIDRHSNKCRCHNVWAWYHGMFTAELGQRVSTREFSSL